MNNEARPKLIALVGGSGAGKSWLANRLCHEFGDEATSLSLDDFYRDLSHLTPPERERINFDDPDTIDWHLFEGTLRKLKHGWTALTPRYDFVSHTRLTAWEPLSPRPFIFVEGLWLLWHSQVRRLFNRRFSWTACNRCVGKDGPRATSGSGAAPRIQSTTNS